MSPTDTSGSYRGRQVIGQQRKELTDQVVAEYLDGRSVRQIANTIGRSYGFVHRLLREAGVEMRSRGGPRRR